MRDDERPFSFGGHQDLFFVPKKAKLLTERKGFGMVWARTRLLIWDYVFEPVKQITIAYTGRHPELFYKKIHELIRTIFNVPEGYIQEKEYRWERHKEAEHFEVGWEITKIFDVFTYLNIEVEINGFVSVEGEGKAKIVLKPRLITEYPQDTMWQQSIFYEMTRRAWHRLHYHKKRMEYLYLSKELTIDFERKLKEFSEEIKSVK